MHVHPLVSCNIVSSAGFAERHQVDTAELAAQVEAYTGSKYKQDPEAGAFLSGLLQLCVCQLQGAKGLPHRAGTLPERRRVDVPPAAWIEEMRTPAVDIVLAQFRHQRDGGDLTGQDAAQDTNDEAMAPEDTGGELSFPRMPTSLMPRMTPVGATDESEDDGELKGADDENENPHPNPPDVVAAVTLKVAGSKIPGMRKAPANTEAEPRGAALSARDKRRRLEAV